MRIVLRALKERTILKGEVELQENHLDLKKNLKKYHWSPQKIMECLEELSGQMRL